MTGPSLDGPGGAGSSRVLVALRVPAAPERAFAVFTSDIAQWWHPSPLFQFSENRTGRLAFEPGLDGRLTETYDDGSVFEIGRIRQWEPPHRLALSWRHASFPADRETEVHVRFDPVGDETRITVEHFGWDAFPPEHAARHGFPLDVFQLRLAEWWKGLLRAQIGRHGSAGR
ncbi:MAG: SRPBCC domain-containing protein [Acidimicrobiales bacterium]